MGDTVQVERAAATLQALVAASGALRAVLLLDRDDGEPVVVDCAADGSAEVARGEVIETLDAADAAPLELPSVDPVPVLEVVLEERTVQAPMGVLDGVARLVRDTGRLFPGRSVLTVGFETTDPETPLFIAARRGDPVVLSLAGDEYEMPDGWPV